MSIYKHLKFKHENGVFVGNWSIFVNSDLTKVCFFLIEIRKQSSLKIFFFHRDAVPLLSVVTVTEALDFSKVLPEHPASQYGQLHDVAELRKRHTRQKMSQDVAIW